VTSTQAPKPQAPIFVQESPTLLQRVFSFHSMLMAGLALVAVLTVSTRFNDPDLWFHLKLGQVIWTTHSIPTTDTFSFTVYGHPWTAHEWLAELSIYAAYHLGGYSGLMLWLAGLTSILLGLSYFLCYRYCRNALVSLLGALCVLFFGTVGLAVRPLLLGNTFLVVELILLTLGTRNRRWLWALPPLFAVWVNCHGSYFFGMAVLFASFISTLVHGQWGLIVAERCNRNQQKQFGIALLVSAAALCCNPVGFRLLWYPLDALLKQQTGLNAVEEWLPPDLRSVRALAMIAAVVLLLTTPLLRRAELRLLDLILLAMAFWLSLQHVRMLFLFGIVVSPQLCQILAPLVGADRKSHHPIANAIVIIGLLTVAARAIPAVGILNEQVQKGNPSGAVAYIRQAGLTGPMLNEYVFGDYLIWALPEEKVFIDGRADVYDWAGVFAEYGRWATLEEDPNILLGKYRIRLCLLSSRSPLGRVMPYLGWRKAFSDDTASVFIR